MWEKNPTTESGQILRPFSCLYDKCEVVANKLLALA